MTLKQTDMAEDTGLEQIAPRLGPKKRLMGLDLGTRTIGVALADRTLSVATPLETIRRTKFGADAAALTAIMAANDIAAIVLGMPLNMDGSEGPRAQSTRAFARNFGKLTACPIVLWDERLSTVAVERTLIAADRSRKRRAEIVDKIAAAYILQGALDRLRSLQGEQGT